MKESQGQPPLPPLTFREITSAVILVLGDLTPAGRREQREQERRRWRLYRAVPPTQFRISRNGTITW